MQTELNYLKRFSENDLRNAIWHLSDGREPLPGGYAPTVEEIRTELRRRGLSDHGYHE